jgi:hypothetical protein
MIRFRDRTYYKVKLLNKLIKEGYKVWVLGDSGYVYDWLWYSRVDGPEGISKQGLDIDRASSIQGVIKVRLTLTFALIIRLAQRLRKIYLIRIFCFFLDNLFFNLNVA